MTQSERTPDQARHDLYEIMQSDASFEEKAARALELGEAYLEVENGHLTRIDADDAYWETIASTDPDDGDFPAGLVLDLNTTYCRRVIEDDASIALHDAPEQGWQDDPAFDTHGLHCYHGTPLTVDGEPWGTVCFVSKTPRAEPFTEGDTMFAELIARLLEHELEHAQQEAKLNRRADLITVLSRVLRHNLRNDMTAIRGQLSRISNQNEDVAALCEPLYRQIDKLIDLSNTARRFESIVDTKHEYYQMDLIGLVSRTVSQLRPDYPRASFTVKGPDSVPISVMGSFQRALEELIENAAEHTRSDDPQVTVTIADETEHVIVHVEDNGPGLPDQERAVLREGTEKPLMHGSGLGLWLVYWIVTDHDGTIETEVTETGTRVTVTLPRTSSQPDVTDPTVLKRRFKREQDRFEAVFEEAFDGMVLFDDDRRIIDANSRAAELSAMAQPDLIGRSIDEFVGEAIDFETIWQEFRDSGWHQGSFPIVRPDGTERFVEYTATADIVPDQHLVVLRDVTDRKQREHDLERYETIVESITDSVWVYDEEKRVTFANRELIDRLPLARDQVVGAPLAAFEDFFENPGTFETWERLVDQVVAGDITEAELDVVFEISDERVVANLRMVPLSDRGAPAKVVVIARDITDRRHRERELEWKTRAMEKAPVGITIADATREDTPLIYANERFQRLTGYALDDVLGRNCRVLQGAGTDPASVAEIRDAIENERPVSVELRNYRADGTEFWNALDIAPVRDETGDVTHYVGFQRDVTDRRARETELTEVNQMLETILTNVPIVLWTTDDEGVFTRSRGAGLARLGLEPDEVVGESVFERYEAFPEICTASERALAGECVTTRVTIDEVEFETWFSPLRADTGEVGGMVGLAYELTEPGMRAAAIDP